MRRRQLLAASLAGGAALAAPALVRAQGARGDARADTLRFIPQSDLTVTDPVWTTADVTRNFGFMVHDTLYGLDAQYAAHPQMVEGHTVSADGLQWDLTLREGLRFHDNTPVLARDAVASIRRWARRDGFGTALMSSTAELSAPTDRAVRFRLRAPFPLLPEALATPSSMCCIVPERLAATDPNTQMPEVVGCGPFRFLPAERVSGSRLVCARFENYVPRAEPVSFTAGGKRVHFERVVWTVQPDAATALGALSRGEFDWWENPDLDLVPTVKTTPDITVAVRDQTGEIGCMRFNSLHPPFNNEAICRLVVSAIDQGAFMQAVAGSVPELVHTGVGILAPASPFASTAGVDTMRGPADPAALRRALTEAGYKGEPVVLLAPGNYPTINALALVGADLLRRIGFTVDVQTLDWGALVQRRSVRSAPSQGGWNIFFTFLGGTGNIIPAANTAIRANGAAAWFGWPDHPSQQALLAQWFTAPDLAAQKQVIASLQTEFFRNPSYAPLGMYSPPTAFRRDIVDVPDGFALFYGVRRAG